ncbi:sensor histidine kinase [Microtetraspora niveoalba]|uniref:sensor histidine kinase n=1 Tax=Microtetraspora niveoalba TaxID=46175 RepID=UPI000B1A834D|nr:histidine kinase [Microtetraspora niveoalba]
MRWRGGYLDLSLAASGVVLNVLMAASSWGGPSAPPWAAAVLALLGGLPLALLRRWPGPTALVLAVLLAVYDQLGASTVDAVQILLPVAVGVLARLRGWRWTAPAAVLACVATALNLADPGIAFTRGAWFYTVGIVAVPVIIGRYLRGAALRRPSEDDAPLLDLLMAGGGLALAVLGSWPNWDSGVLPVWGVGLMVVLSGLALGVVRRLPGAVLLLESLLVVVADQYFGEVGTTLQILLFVALGVFATRASWGWVVAGYLLTCAVAVITIVDGDTEVTAWRALALTAMVAAPVAIGGYVRARQDAARHAAELAAARNRADRLAERERIARDVHDIVAHHVGAMVLRASAALYAGADGPAKEALDDIRATGHGVLTDLRGLLDVLRDPGRDDIPSADPGDVVQDAVARMTAAGLRVELDIAPETERAPLVVRASAARIVQEGLTNVLKHAGPGTEARVKVGIAGGELAVEIRNGPGAAAPGELPSTGQGINGMRERAGALGGRLTAGPAEDGGWRLAAALPVRTETTERCRP